MKKRIAERKAVKDELRKQQSTLSSIINGIDALIFSLDRQYRYTSFNQEHATVMRALYGAEIELGHSLLDYMTVAEDRTIAKGNLDRALAGEQLVEEGYSGEELRSRRYFRVSHSPIKSEQGDVIGVAVLAQDLTERKQAEETLRHLNRELRAISICNQTLLRAVDEQMLLEDICRIICDEAGYRMAWVGYLEHDDAKTVRPVAWAGFEDGYLATVNITWADVERGQGTTGTALRNGKLVYTQDFATDPRFAPWRADALQRGYRCNIALPLKDENAHTFGALTIYSAQPNAFTPDEIRLLEELAGDLAFGVTTLRTRAEHKRAEASLWETSQMLKLVLDNMPAFVFWKDRNSVYLGCNRLFAANAGFSSPQEIVGLTDLDLPWKDAEAESYRADDRRVMGTGLPKLNYEETQLTADGRVTAVRTSKVPLRNPAGDVIGVLGTFEDISARKQAEMQLRASEQLFRALVENSPDSIARYDRQFRRIYVNPAIQKLFPSPAASVLGKTPADQSPLYAPQIYIDHLRQAIEAAAESTLEIPYRTAQGEMRWGQIRFVPEFDPDGKVASVLAIGRDIHEIKENERRFRMLAENFPDFVVRFDRDGRFTYVNPAVEKAFGLTAETMIGKTLQELPPRSKPEQNDALLALIRRAVDEGVANESEAYWEIETGARIFETRHVPEKDATGNVVSVLSITRDITDRKRAEEALRDSERRLAEAQRIAHVGYWERNFDVCRIILSDEACRIFGLSPQEVPLNLEQWHQRWLELIHPEDRPRLVQAVVDALGDGPPYNVEYRIVKPGGEVRFIHSEASVRRDESGRPRYMLGMMQDITERKRAEEALRESEDLLRVTLENISDPVFITDDAGAFTFICPNAPHILGYTLEEFEAMGNVSKLFGATLFSPEELDRRGKIENIECKIARKDGDRRDFLVTVKRVAIHKGTVLYTCHDITDRKRAEEALRESEDRYRMLFNVMDEGVAINEIARDEKGDVVDYTILEVNPAFTKNSHYTREQVLGKHATDLYHMSPEYIRDWWQNHTGMQQVAHTEFYHAPSNRWFHVTTTPPQANRFATFSVDITERKRAEEEIRKLNQELEQRVAERTAQLEATNKELEAFAYSVSHDLRAPLRHIDGFLELLQKRTADSLDAPSQHYMATIAESAKRMGALIDDLLSFSQMRRFEMSKLQVDLNALVQDVLRELASEAAGRNIKWRIADLPMVTGDRAMLRIVLTNLISNALKFTRPREQAEIEIGCLPEQEKETAIFIRDNGVGFDPNYADQLFGVFQRLHRAEEFEGTGIGLASVRRIINRHGGRTWAEGELNRGATFYFSLPRKLEEA